MYCARYHKCPRKQQTLAEVEKNQKVFSICVFNMNFIWIWILIILIIFWSYDKIKSHWFDFWINDSYWYGFSIWTRILKNTFCFFFPRDRTHFLMRLQLSTSDLKCCLSILLFDSLGPSCRSSHNAWMVFKSGLIGLQICPWDLLVPGHV